MVKKGTIFMCLTQLRTQPNNEIIPTGPLSNYAPCPLVMKQKC